MNAKILAAAKAYAAKYMNPHDVEWFIEIIKDMIRLDYFK